MCHNRRFRPQVNNHHCQSEVDNSANTLTMAIRVFFNFVESFTDHPPGVDGPVVYECTPSTDQIRSNFELALAASVRDHWHNRLWLETALPDPNVPSLRCGVTVEFVPNRTWAHLQITALCDPEPAASSPQEGFRSFCARGGRSNVYADDMVLAYRQRGGGQARAFEGTGHFPVQGGGSEPFTQNVAAHEFGHYLGLNHRCFTEATANADEDYCIGREPELMRNMMAVGGEVTTQHGEPWLSRLRRHHHQCERTWRLVLNPTRVFPGLINSLAA